MYTSFAHHPDWIREVGRGSTPQEAFDEGMATMILEVIKSPVQIIVEKTEGDFDFHEWIGEKNYTLQPTNKSSDELQYNIELRLARHFGLRHWQKYQELLLVNGDNQEVWITIRTSDHTHNPSNGKCDVGIIFANHDATKNIFNTASEELRFEGGENEDEVFDQIIEAIEEAAYWK